MKKRYVLAIALAAFMRVQSRAQDVPSSFGPQQVIVEQDAYRPNDTYATDLDGDGDQDILSTSIGNDELAWYANDGQGNFRKYQVIATQGGSIESIYTADLDGDGDQDVLIASSPYNNHKIAWYENDGKGSFGEEQVIATQADDIKSVYATDVDGDGDQDVLSASYLDGNIAWYENDGPGNFGEQQIITTQANGAFSVYAADLDGDGDQDVLSASYLDGKVAWYENDGQGNFGEQQVITETDGARFVYATDLDGDGDQDILFASSSYNSNNKIAWYENDGQGSFGEQQVITTQTVDARSVYAADLDGDGDQDVLSAFYLSGNIAWYENDGQGNFGEQQVITTRATGTQSIYATDLDGDGDQDVLSASSTSSNSKIAWYENDGQGSFGEQQYVTNKIKQINTVYAADLDGDGDQDVLSASSYLDGIHIAWYQNDGQGNFEGQRSITEQADGARSVYTADLDGDGDQDVLSASSTSSNSKIAWYENDGQGNFGDQQVITTQADGARSVYATDLDGDGDQDVLSASGDKIAWYENDGQGSFGEQQVITTQADGARSVYATDLDGDGDQDVLSASFLDDKIAWYENDGQGSFGEQQVITTQADGTQSVYAADLDGDGDQDVLSASGDKIAWYENDGQGSFGEQQVITTRATGTQSIYATNLDGDGDQDVLSASGDKIAWYENDGQGSFGEQQVITTQADGARSVYAADLDGDGDQDVLSASNSYSVGSKIAWYEKIQPEPTVTSLTLFNARTNAEVRTLNIRNSIDLLSLDLRDYNIEATVAPRETVTRVKFDLTAPARQDTITNEFKLPYALYGDKPNGDFRRRKSYDGEYQLTVTPYYQDSTGNEVEGISKTVAFTFVARGLRARNLRLVDTHDNSLIEPLDDGDVITLARDQRISILADSRYPQYNSLEFFLDGPNPDGTDEVQALENLVPYAIFGDDGLNTNPNGRPLAAGEYELRVVPYQGKNRASYAGPEEVVRFKVTRDWSASPVVYPVPLQDEVMIRVTAGEVSGLTLRHAYGQTYSVPMSQVRASGEGIRVDLHGLNLPVGPYVLEVVHGGDIQRIPVIKE